MGVLDNLSGTELAALEAIVEGPGPDHEPWSEALDLERRGHQMLTIAGLVASGWVELWTVARVDYVTLTPLGAARLGVRLEEHWAGQREWRWADEVDPKTKKLIRKRYTVTVHVEEPAWVRSTLDVIEDRRPVRLPQQARFCELGNWLADKLMDAGSSPEETAILKEEAERTEDGLIVLHNGEPLTLFGGHPVKLDRRLKGASNGPGRMKKPRLPKGVRRGSTRGDRGPSIRA